MKKSICLNGEWKLYRFPEETSDPVSPEGLAGTEAIPAMVPSNVELDLAEAGVIPKELFKGMITEENRKWESYCWWYETKFDLPPDAEGKRVFLRFDAVDCLAEYFLNGEKIYESDNAFRETRFEITGSAKPHNVLHVHIRPAVPYALSRPYSQYMVWRTGEEAHLRKPAHSFGWDIFPRAVSAGIWRDVFLEVDDRFQIEECSYVVFHAAPDHAQMRFYITLDIPYEAYRRNVSVRVKGVCGESVFRQEQNANHFKAINMSFTIPEPKLWQPFGYGEPNLYETTCELLLDGEVRDVRTMNVGLRTVELLRSETQPEEGCGFQFLINGVPVMCRGSNWVPLAPYHSMDKARYEKALALFAEANCNIVRVWGGGVYEQKEFYDLCDRLGIMVWQDFMMACAPVCMEDEMLKKIQEEAEWVVRTLREHPSIILWSGDNEIDEKLARDGRRPGMNRITRQILPDAVERNDAGRPYLPSSPYVTDSRYRDYGKKDVFPEIHLWGARDYFKADYYRNSRASFVSETGYHGCPDLESLNRIVDEDALWPIFNEQWSLHSSDQAGSLHRVRLMWDQIIQLFGFEPENLEDFILASQISQAEAKKFFVERVRLRKPETSGIIWWNMLDGWPQMSDAVVDFFFRKKLAFDYIRRSQEPFVLMMDELRDWHYPLVASNDTMEKVSGTYRVYDIDTEETLAQGKFMVPENANLELDSIRLYYPEKRFLVLEWETGGKKFYNHYLCGMPPFDFKQYRGWLEKFDRLTK